MIGTDIIIHYIIQFAWILVIYIPLTPVKNALSLSLKIVWTEVILDDFTLVRFNSLSICLFFFSSKDNRFISNLAVSRATEFIVPERFLLGQVRHETFWLRKLRTEPQSYDLNRLKKQEQKMCSIILRKFACSLLYMIGLIQLLTIFNISKHVNNLVIFPVSLIWWNAYRIANIVTGNMQL